jgi:hypothetical protein
MVRRNDLLQGPLEKAIAAIEKGEKQEALRWVREV